MKKIWKRAAAALAAILLCTTCLIQEFCFPPSVAAAMELAEMQDGVYGADKTDPVYTYDNYEFMIFNDGLGATTTSVFEEKTTTTITMNRTTSRMPASMMPSTTSTTTAELITRSSSPAQFLWKLQDVTLEPGNTGTYGVDISNAMESYGLQGTLYLPPATRALLQNVDFDNALADNVYLDLLFSCNANKLSENGSLGFAFFGASSEIPYHTDGTLFTFDFQVPDVDTLLELYHQYGLSIEDGCLVFPVQWKELGYDYVEMNGELVPFARYGYLDKSVTDCFDSVALEDGAIRIKVPDGLIVEESTPMITTDMTTTTTTGTEWANSTQESTTTTEISSGSAYVAMDSLTVAGGSYHVGDMLELHIQYDERLHGDCYIRITNDEATSKLLVQENVLLDDLYTYTFDRDYSGDLHIDIEFRYTGDSQHSLTIADVTVSRGTGTTMAITTTSTTTSTTITTTTGTTNSTETGYYVVLGKPEQNVLKVGNEIRLLFNSNASSLIWSSSDSEIASVDQNGVVSVYNSGNVTIYAVVKEDPSKIASVTLNIPKTGQMTVDRGDVTRDGMIGLDDAYAILMYNSYQAVGISYNFTDGSNSELEQLVRQAADVDESGEINLRDAYSTLMYNSYQSIGMPNLTWEMVIA